MNPQVCRKAKLELAQPLPTPPAKAAPATVLTLAVPADAGMGEPQRPRRDWPLTVARVAGLACAAFGAAVLVGWHSALMFLVQWEPGITPVAYNAGVCFILGGLAILALSLRRNLAANLFASVVAAIAASTLAAYVISTAAHRELLYAQPEHARMAPNTSLAFLLLAGALLLAGTRKREAGSGTPAALGALGASLGLLGLCGYAAGLPSAYGWGHMKPMAPQAALGLMVLGTGVIAWSWAQDRGNTNAKSWVPRLSLLASVAFSVALWLAVRISHPHELLPALVLVFGLTSGGLLFAALRLGGEARLRAQLISQLNLDLRRQVERTAAAGEEAQRASAYARSLIEASLDPLVTIGQDGRIMDVNRATEEATGRGREDLIGSDFCAYFTSPELAREGYQRVFREGRVQDYPLAIRRSDGHVTDVLYNATVYRNQGREIEGVFAAARDITQRKRMEEELRVSRQRLVLALKAAEAGNFDWDMLNNRVIWTPDTEQLYGLAPGEFRGTYEAWEQLVVPADLPPAVAAIRQAVETGEFKAEFRIRRPSDGQVRWIDGHAKVLHDAGGQPARMIGINMDITARKRAEATVRILSDCHAAILRAENEEHILQHLCELIVRDGTYRLAWVGIPQQDEKKSVRVAAHAGADAGYLADIELSWDENASNGRGPFGTAIRSRTAQVCSNMPEAGRGRPWGEIAARHGFMSTAALPLLDGGKLLGCLSIYASDAGALGENQVQLLTELANNVAFGVASLRYRADRERMAASLEERGRELERVNRELEAFAYSVSHDLRAPLRSVDGFSQILLEDYTAQLDENGKDCLRRVRAGCQNMGRLIDAVLQLSRISRSEMRLEMVDISLLALSEAAMLRLLHPNRTVEFHVAAGLQARGDRKLLEIALQNLIENAWKFTARQPHARIDVGVTERDGSKAFYVRDNGAGFDMAYAGKLFQPFQRLHSCQDYEGTGIGLATVHRILQRLGGKIWAEGAAGQGATFYFSLS